MPKSLMKLPGSTDQQMSVRSSRDSYAVSGDGQRFPVPIPAAASPAAPPITVWLNWDADLKNYWRGGDCFWTIASMIRSLTAAFLSSIKS
jgi:hypothetical protein